MIYLRNLTIDDFDYLNSVENNKSFLKYSFQNKNYSKEDLIQFIYDSQLPLEQTNQIRFVICKIETDEPLGFIDLFEINEAFATVALANMKILGLKREMINIYGGAVAMGHPLGCSGARIISTLIHNLIQEEKSTGIASICNGGGGSTSMMINTI